MPSPPHTLYVVCSCSGLAALCIVAARSVGRWVCESTCVDRAYAERLARMTAWHGLEENARPDRRICEEGDLLLGWVLQSSSSSHTCNHATAKPVWVQWGGEATVIRYRTVLQQKVKSCEFFTSHVFFVTSYIFARVWSREHGMRSKGIFHPLETEDKEQKKPKLASDLIGVRSEYLSYAFSASARPSHTFCQSAVRGGGGRQDTHNPIRNNSKKTNKFV